MNLKIQLLFGNEKMKRKGILGGIFAMVLVLALELVLSAGGVHSPAAQA